MVRPTKPEYGTELEKSSDETQAARLESNAEVSELCSRNGGQEADTGAQSGNTAPSNCTELEESTKILRSGIDSLYVSYKGTISEETESTLESLKQLARSEDPELIAEAFFHLKDHCFEVKGWGSKKYAYVLQDNWYHLKVASSNAKKLPMIHAQIGSEILTRSGFQPSVYALNLVASSIGETKGGSSVGRVDLCVDFITDYDIQQFSRHAWVSRSNKFQEYHVGQYLTGMAFGQGSALSARLYNKLIESRLSKKDYLYPLWKKAGWNDDQAVWRLEFQIKSSILRQFDIVTISDLKEKLPGLWEYCTREWLKLTIPSATDQTQSRWPIHPMWQALSQADWGYRLTEPLYRSRKDRAPSDDYLFVNGLSAITSLMAREGIASFDVAIQIFKDCAQAYHLERSKKGKPSLEAYAMDKAREKAVKFNTVKKEEV